MLRKEAFNDLKTGWMSPEGDFYPTEYMEHLATADEIWTISFGDPSPNDVDRKLVSSGWCEIHCLTFREHGFLFNFEGHLSPEQKAVIKPVYEENKHRILKSSALDLEEEFYGGVY